jgi:hypothetical protein
MNGDCATLHYLTCLTRVHPVTSCDCISKCSACTGCAASVPRGISYKLHVVQYCSRLTIGVLYISLQCNSDQIVVLGLRSSWRRRKVLQYYCTKGTCSYV